MSPGRFGYASRMTEPEQPAAPEDRVQDGTHPGTHPGTHHGTQDGPEDRPDDEVDDLQRQMDIAHNTPPPPHS